MTFEEWLRFRKLAESSVAKYSGAISGVMSQWAIDGGLIDGPLTAIKSREQFEKIAEALRQLPIYVERNVRGNNMYSSALNKYAEFLAEGFDNDVESDVEAILCRSDISGTEKNQLIKTRIGQGSFRQKLIAYWQGCAVTGYTDSSLLVASHIKPWRTSSNSERLDHFNGLLLLPNLDRAFDAGLITFTEVGKVVLSPLLTEPALLGINAAMKVKLSGQHLSYMQFHRDIVFRSAQ